MKFYLVDDSTNVLSILDIIIRERGLGRVCGTAQSALDALGDLKELEPDIVVVDLLMPEMDGITFVRKARQLRPDTAYVMLSQVADKAMIASAYEAGVEFFVNKPINAVEVETVLGRVSQALTMRRTLSQVTSLLGGEGGRQSAAPAGESRQDRVRQRCEDLLRRIGILGEAGARDIISIVCYLDQHPQDSGLPVSALCARVGDVPKSTEQRLRRAAFAGLVNLANMGLDDYSSEVFADYAGALYRFEQVRREMNFISGKGKDHGTVQLKNFLSAVFSYSTQGHF